MRCNIKQDKAMQGKTSYDEIVYDKIKQDVTRCDKTRQDNRMRHWEQITQYKTRHDESRESHTIQDTTIRQDSTTQYNTKPNKAM